MVHLCFVISRSEIGGAQVWLRDQVILMRSKNVNVSVVSSDLGWLSEEVKSIPGVYFHIIPSISKSFSILSIFKLIFFILKYKPSCIISSSASAGVASRIGSFVTRTKNVYVSHGWSCLYNGGKFKSIYSVFEKLLSIITTTVLCISESDYKNALNVLHISKSKLVLVTNGVFTKNTEVKLKPFETEDVFTLLSVGRLENPKRFDLLIEAVSTLNKVELTIVGDGRLKATLAESNNVNMIGEITPFDKFSDYHAFCLISDSEGLPMSAIEAASLSRPLLLSNVGGCPELISNTFQNGVLVENDINHIRDAILKIKDNYLFFSSNASKVSTAWSLENKVDDYLKVYFIR